ncbi:hypothetical protein ACFLZX_03035 [Nanoarchaeota archaeon]
MGIGIGFPKYVIFTLLSGWGFVSMYLFGGTITTLFNTFHQLFSGNFIQAFLHYYVYSALPPTSIEHVIIQAILGAVIAGSSWFVAMAARGVPL